jgi:dolichol-phosphate mannosyltransferase
MESGFTSLPGARFAMDGKGLKFNMSSATNITCYRQAESGAKAAVQVDNAAPPGPREKLALIIPALYEAENLGALLSALRDPLRRVGLPWEVIVVDDESRDGTEEIVSAIAREDPLVRLLIRRGERGLSGAILHGWRHTDATILGVMDADGQHPAEVLSSMLDSIRAGHDVAMASRYVRGGRCGANPIRCLVSMTASLAARRLLPARLRVSDPLSGFFLVRRHCLENVSFQTSGFKLLLEILVRGRIDSVEEIPFAFGRRRAGHSKVTPRVAWDYVSLLTRLYRARFAMARIPQSASGD